MVSVGDQIMVHALNLISPEGSGQIAHIPPTPGVTAQKINNTRWSFEAPSRIKLEGWF